MWTNRRSRNASPVLFLAIASCFGGFSSCQTASLSEANKLSFGETQNVLVLIAQEDPSGSFYDLDQALAQNLAMFPQIESPNIVRVDGAEQFRKAILAEAALRGPIDALLLAFHGQPNRLYLSATETLHQRNLEQRCQGLSQALHPEAPVILYSCLTGEGDDNLARDLANVLDRPVVAPAYYWLMQTSLMMNLRTPELALDSRGRLTVDADQFGLFYKKRHRVDRDRYLIAPLAMSGFCRADGFLKRRAKQRLFQRYEPR